MWCPEAAEPGEPLVDTPQRLTVDGVEPPLAVAAYRRETVVPQYLQVLRDGRLADLELGLNRGSDGARGQFAVGEKFEDSPTNWVAQDVERVHRSNVEDSTYIS